MRYVRLGKTDLEVSAIAFGTWSFGGDWGGFDADEAKKTVGRALEGGITFFDTAQAYGFGASERLLADALWSRVERDRVVVATKGGLRKDGNTLHRDASARSLREGVEASLRDLRTDYIDLYQVHWPDPKTPAEETGRVLADLVREGKIRHAGVSNYSPRQMTDLARYGAGRDRSAAVPHVPSRHRGRGPSVYGAERYRDAGLRSSCPRPALRDDDAADDLRGGRLARQQR
jgi:aryl-alcohol dehydrogenase-like predicted oxidoreductase